MLEVITNLENQFKKTHNTDAGYDIRSAIDAVIPAKDSFSIDTDLKVSIPEGYVGLVKSRSGLAFKHDIDTGAGVIDCGYTGEVKIKLFNHSNVIYSINVGDKIAQMIIIPIYTGEVKYVEKFNEVDFERGEKGFNSSGY